jgi:hypothetical protein
MSLDAFDTEVVRLLEVDAVATLGSWAAREVRAAAADLAHIALNRMQPVEASAHWPASPGDSFAESQAFFDRNVVDRFQLKVHDEYWDTAWPACPRHPNHPLWYHDRAWWCEADRVPIAPLGGLACVRPRVADLDPPI